MASFTQFQIKGAQQMEKLLEELGPRAAGRAGDAALRAGASVIVDEAKRLVPVDTGALRDSITIKTERRRKGEEERVVLIGFKPPVSRRAHLAEYGSSKTAATPFMRPAMDSKAAEALDAIGAALERGITREAKKLAKPVRK